METPYTFIECKCRTTFPFDSNVGLCRGYYKYNGCICIKYAITIHNPYRNIVNLFDLSPTLKDNHGNIMEMAWNKYVGYMYTLILSLLLFKRALFNNFYCSVKWTLQHIVGHSMALFLYLLYIWLEQCSNLNNLTFFILFQNVFIIYLSKNQIKSRD